MMKKKIPTLKTEEEVDEFWSRHDFADHLDEFETVPEGVHLDQKLARKIRERARKKHLIAIRLDDEQFTKAQHLALRKSLGLSSLVRMWISEAIRREARAA